MSVRDQSSRWGSCSTSGVLSYSWRLILAPPFVLDYLAAHEVAHLIEMNYSRKFWRLVERICPDMGRAKAWLDAHGADLHRYGSIRASLAALSELMATRPGHGLRRRDPTPMTRIRMLRPGTFALTALLAALSAIGPLTTDMYLPSLPDIARQLHASTAQVQFTISAYLIGFAVGQIFYGPLSDRHGRKPVLMAAMALYCVASLACALSTSIEMLIVARAFQALGGSGGIVLARAIVRDIYSGARAGRELSLIGSVMALAPVLAPIAGGLLQTGFGWRAIFFALVAAGLLGAAIVWLLLPETLNSRAAEPVSPASMLPLLSHRRAESGLSRLSRHCRGELCGPVRLDFGRGLRAAESLRTDAVRFRRGLRAWLGRLHDRRGAGRAHRRSGWGSTACLASAAVPVPPAGLAWWRRSRSG